MVADRDALVDPNDRIHGGRTIRRRVRRPGDASRPGAPPRPRLPPWPPMAPNAGLAGLGGVRPGNEIAAMPAIPRDTTAIPAQQTGNQPHASVDPKAPAYAPAPPQRSEKRAGEAVPVARSEGEETVSDARWGGWRREQVRTPERQRPARRAHLRGDRDGRVAASGSARRPRGAIGWLVNAARQHAIFSGIAAVNHLVREFA